MEITLMYLHLNNKFSIAKVYYFLLFQKLSTSDRPTDDAYTGELISISNIDVKIRTNQNHCWIPVSQDQEKLFDEKT